MAEVFLGVSLWGEARRINQDLQSITGPSAAGLHLSRDTICLTSQAQTKHKSQLFIKERLWELLGRQHHAGRWTPGSVLSPAPDEQCNQLGKQA